MSERYYALNQIRVGAIFSIIGIHNKPFLRVKGGYADMTNGNYYEINSSQDTPIRCKLLNEVTLAKSYGKTSNWVDAWKEEISRKIERNKK
jgi:hypothetical protein